MKKVSTIIENITFIASLNTAAFFCTYYLRRCGHDNSYFDIIFDILFLAATIFFYITAFTKGTSIFSQDDLSDEENSRKPFLIRIVFLLILRVAFEVIMRYTAALSFDYTIILSNALLVLYIGASYLISVKRTAVIWQRKRNLLFFAGAMIAVFAVLFVIDVPSISKFCTAERKYLENAPQLTALKNSLLYSYSVKTFVCETLIFGGLIIFHTVCTDNGKKNNNGHYLNRAIFTMILRCGIVMLIFFIIYFGKFMISQDVLIYVDKNRESSTHHLEYSEADTVTDERYASKGLNGKYLFYYQNILTLSKGDDEERFVLSRDKSSIDVYPESLGHTKYIFYDKPIYLYGNYAIFLYDNDIPQIIRIENLGSTKENELVTELCKNMINTGNLSIFEYSAQYLWKYDKDFIQPYIERYAKGEFLSKEERRLKELYYREEYIINIAKSFVS